MSVARVSEISAQSPEGFEHAIKEGITYAGKNLGEVKGVWIKEQQATVENGSVSAYRVDMQVTYMPR